MNKRRSPLTAPAIIVLVLVLILLVRGTFTVYEKWSYAGEAAYNAQQEVARLRERKAELEAQISKLQSPEGTEAALREQYQVGKPGENVITVTDSTQATTSAQEATLQTSGFWNKIRSWFQ